jgi:hypothetical protein
MVYKQKLTLLSGIVGLLALIYVVTLIFEPERAGRRNAAFSWLDQKLVPQVEGIRILSAPDAEALTLVRKNKLWYVSHEENEYPARQLRVDDFLALLSQRAAYPVRASSSAAHERLGLTEGAAARIVLTGASPPAREGAEVVSGPLLLDLLAGQGDLLGQEIYLRKAGQNEVRSGENRFSGYLSGTRQSWYNLRLFPESEDGKLEAADVQKLTVYPPASALTGQGIESPEPQVFSRENNGWICGGITVTSLDNAKVDSYILSVLNIEGDDFSSSAKPEDPIFNDGRLTLELGDGSIRTLRLGGSDESNRRLAVVSGSPHVYSLAGWAVDRLFREASYFEK